MKTTNKGSLKTFTEQGKNIQDELVDFRSKITKYEHHGVEVSTQIRLKGTHREHCLCYCNCNRFKPGKDDNCEIAKANYELCVKYNITTPVFECPKYGRIEL